MRAEFMSFIELYTVLGARRNRRAVLYAVGRSYYNSDDNASKRGTSQRKPTGSALLLHIPSSEAKGWISFWSTIRYLSSLGVKYKIYTVPTHVYVAEAVRGEGLKEISRYTRAARTSVIDGLTRCM